MTIRTKLWNFSVKTFIFYFFGGHMKIPTKLWHFPRLYWSSQNRRRVLFELTPGRRLALGAPASFKEMWQRWRAVGNTMFDFTGPRFELRTSCSRRKRITARPTNRSIT